MRISIALGMLSFAAIAVSGSAVVRSLPQPAVELTRSRGAAVAEAGALRWEAQFSPAEDRSRLQVRLDRHRTLPLDLVGDEGIALTLNDLAPGLHFIELEMSRRGGRITRFSDEVLAGPWQADVERGCDVGLTLSPEGVRDLLLPVLEAKLLAGVRGSEYFGSTSFLARKELEVVDGGLRFDVSLDTREEGKGDISVGGVIDIRGEGETGVVASLRSLSRASPGPKLEAIARAEGGRRIGAIGATVGGGLVAVAGGGPLLGLAVAAGGGWLGSEIGEGVGERRVRHEARREARLQIERALVVATDALRLPDEVVVLPGDPALRASVRWCEEPSLSASLGLQARLRIDLFDDEIASKAARQAVFLDTRLPDSRLPRQREANLHVDVSADFINRLLAEWVVRGGLQERLDASGLRQELQASLGDRTRWRVDALGVELPPMVRPRAEGRIEVTMGGVVLELRDDARAATRTVVLGASGELVLVPQESLGQVRLGGSLDAAYFGCRERDEHVERRLPCFSSVLDPGVLRAQLDEQLKARADSLPVLDLGALLRLRIFGGESGGGESSRALELDGFWIEAGEGVLEVDALLR